eukprot:SAG31_NODE_35219_length_325_cov_0.690265_1_plen_76_part_10
MHLMQVQAYTARAADAAAQQRQQEMEISETTRQREHEIMVVQIARVSRSIDECCPPVILALAQLGYACNDFVAYPV